MISVSTEITDEQRPGAKGWILFDGECEFCRGWARRMEAVLGPRGFRFLPLQTPWVRARLGLPEEELLGEMRVLLRDGETLGGADAILELAKYVWWGWPLVALAHVPGVRRVLRVAYRRVAARRRCVGGACMISREPEGLRRER